MTITPFILSRVYDSLYHVPPASGPHTASLMALVREKLFCPDAYAAKMKFSELDEAIYKNRFIVENICRAIMKHPMFKDYPSITAVGSKQYHNWAEPKYDISCSAKIDYLLQSGIIQLYLTSCTTHDQFIIDVYQRKYHRTAAFVSDGLGKRNYIIIGINKKKYNTFTINMADHPDMMQDGRNEYEHLIDSYLLMPDEQKQALAL